MAVAMGFTFTVAVAVAVDTPEVAVTVMVEVPRATPVTAAGFPLWATVAAPVFEDVHVYVYVPAGCAVAVSEPVPPTPISRVVGLTVTFGFTVKATGTDVVTPFALDTAVIFAVPRPTAFTVPLASTVATASLLEAHVTAEPVLWA